MSTKTEPVAQAPESAPAKTGPDSKPAKTTSAIARFDDVRDRCVQLFGSEERFIQEATFLLRAVNDTPALQECTPNSITGVLLSIASTGLSLNPVLRHAYIIPRNTKVKTAAGDKWEKRASVEPSYMGLMKLATDTGSVRHFEAQVVYQGDEFDYDLVAKKPRTHRPYWTRGMQRGKLLGVYGYATLVDGTVIPEHMGADELGLIQSKSDNRNGSVYSDWQGEMARKSLIKRLRKYLPQSDRNEAFLEAIELDNQGYQLAPASSTNAASGTYQEALDLQAQVREAIKSYQGEDKQEIKKQCAEFAHTGKVDAEFWRGILNRLQAK